MTFLRHLTATPLRLLFSQRPNIRSSGPSSIFPGTCQCSLCTGRHSGADPESRDAWPETLTRMLSQHHFRLADSAPGTTAARGQLLASPPLPQHFLGGCCPALQQQIGVPLLGPNSLQQTTLTSRDYVASCAQFQFPIQTAKEVGQWRMMPPCTSTTAPTPSRPIQFTFQVDRTNTVFSFHILPRLEMALSFPPRPSPLRPRKRCRAMTDIDGELSSLHKKKRRLRLFLITSRLSPQFSHPATNIVDRGNSKIAVWAKQKALGRNLLRKAAILNRIRRRAFSAKETGGGLGRMLVEQEREQKQLELADMTLKWGSHDPYTRPVINANPSFPPSLRSPSTSRSPSPSPPSPPLKGLDDTSTSEYRSPNDAYSYSPPPAQRRAHLPLPPSPLGLSNYDALDLEEDIPDPYAHLDDEGEEDFMPYPDAEMDDSSPCPSAVTSASFPKFSTAASNTTKTLKTPPQAIYSDFSKLEPGEPVVGDFDQVDGGADPIWPNILASDCPSRKPTSSSPDFPALFATTTDNTILSSPNAAPIVAPADDQIPRSPNFAHFPTPLEPNEDIKEQWLGKQKPEILVGKDSDLEQERQRQRNLMFMRFGS